MGIEPEWNGIEIEVGHAPVPAELFGPALHARSKPAVARSKIENGQSPTRPGAEPARHDARVRIVHLKEAIHAGQFAVGRRDFLHRPRRIIKMFWLGGA